MERTGGLRVAFFIPVKAVKAFNAEDARKELEGESGREGEREKNPCSSPIFAFDVIASPVYSCGRGNPGFHIGD